MRGRREETLPLPLQVARAFKDMEAFGDSKHEDKRTERLLGLERGDITSTKIYSFSTEKTYLKHATYFVDWCKANPDIRAELGHKPRTLDECRAYVSEWLQTRQGLSAYTQKLERSALAKLYQDKTITEEIETKGTKRDDIERSRHTVEKDKHFSESRNADLINFCKCTGLRRSELEKVDASDFMRIKGEPYIHVTRGTKGGRERYTPIVGTPAEVSKALEYLETLNGHNHIHGACDVHSYRRDYATRVYLSHARPIEELRGKRIDYTAITGKRDDDGRPITKSAVYYCRGDRKGDAMDRYAMLRASQALGHNREDVVGEHYITL